MRSEAEVISENKTLDPLNNQLNISTSITTCQLSLSLPHQASQADDPSYWFLQSARRLSGGYKLIIEGGKLGFVVCSGLFIVIQFSFQLLNHQLGPVVFFLAFSEEYFSESYH